MNYSLLFSNTDLPLESWRRDYYEDRPHSTLGNLPLEEIAPQDLPSVSNLHLSSMDIKFEL